MSLATQSLVLSPDQECAADRIRGWLKGNQFNMTFAGSAGTGKSTVIASLSDELREHRPLYMAPTAKAAFVLQTKGVPAVTIHSAIYLFAGSYVNNFDNEVPIFHEREDIKAEFDPGCFIIDEASMIDERMYLDILAKGKKCLFIGDFKQLPPIGSDPKIMQNADVKLEKIHRQAADSPILRIAHDVSSGIMPSMKHNAPGAVEVMAASHPKSIAKIAVERGYDQVIVGFNKTRHEVNHYMREALGLKGLLTVGDKILCRFNAYRQACLNGMIFRVLRIKSEDEKAFTCDLQLDLGGGVMGRKRLDIRVQKKSLGNPTYKTSEREQGCVDFDYGNALTCNAAQGSSWPSVLYCWQPCRNWSMARHGYTGITRAEKRIAIAL